MICFSIDSPDSLDNAEVLVGIIESLVVFKLTGNLSQFTKELQNTHSSARYMPVGLKKYLRYDWKLSRDFEAQTNAQ
jgi:hypothetical protein